MSKADILREELDAVVVIGQSLSGMVHAPDQNGKPLCGRQPRKQHPNQANDGIYGPKDPAVYPNHELCPDCRQRYVQKSEKITATDGGTVEVGADRRLGSAYNPDVQYCPHCGEPLTGEQRHFREDLVLNRYRTEFKCPACDYHGEVFRHE